MSYGAPTGNITMSTVFRICTLDNAGEDSFVKVYCQCGRLVDYDKKYIGIKHSLKKQIECVTCRNERISKEIDLLNNSFDDPFDTGEDL